MRLPPRNYLNVHASRQRNSPVSRWLGEVGIRRGVERPSSFCRDQRRRIFDQGFSIFYKVFCIFDQLFCIFYQLLCTFDQTFCTFDQIFCIVWRVRPEFAAIKGTEKSSVQLSQAGPASQLVPHRRVAEFTVYYLLPSNPMSSLWLNVS